MSRKLHGTMRYFPINLDLQDKLVIVVGGGEAAYQRILFLLETGATIRVITARPILKVNQLADRKKIELLKRPYKKGDLAKAFLVFAAFDNDEINELVRHEANERNILVNVVNPLSQSSAVLPEIIQRGELLLTVSTGAEPSAIVKKVRQDLDHLFGEEYGVLVEMIKSLKNKYVSDRVEESERLFAEFVRSPILTYIRQGDRGSIDRLLKSLFGEKLGLRSLGVKIGIKG